jgi:hypothetical protein
MLPASFGALVQYPQFILHRNKIPHDTTGTTPSDPHDPANWLPYAEAEIMAQACGAGVGFVFTENDPFFFIDIDHCYDPATQQWNAISMELIGTFSGACMEWSQSGTGVHIFGTYTESFEHSCKNTELNIEKYKSKRFAVLSGQEIYAGQGDAGLDCTSILAHVVPKYFPPGGNGDPDIPVEWTSAPITAGTGAPDADAARRVLLSMKSGRGMFDENHASPVDLWEANEDALSRAYPSQNGHDHYDRSSADMALASHLAFVTGGNCQLMWDLMWASSLVREKWHDRPAYVQETITNAVGRCSNWYTPKPVNDTTTVLPGTSVPDLKPPNPQSDAPGSIVSTHPTATPPVSLPGAAILPITQQIEKFEGCVYIGDLNRIFLPSGRVWKPEQFKNYHAGHKFIIDADGKTTKNAFDAFIDNQAHHFPRVVGAVFRPDLAPGEIMTDPHGTESVNVFVPQFGVRMSGDASPMFDHIANLLPYESDRDILYDYLAGCIQYPGVKFQWCPVIQGVEGNGKSIIYAAMEYAIGQLYCHQVDPRDLDGKFNGWLEFKLLISIEEIRTNARREVADILKPWITNTRVPSQAKGQDQRTIDNVANFILFSNHKDAVLKTATDRRYSVFYTAQQDADDKKLCGMHGGYFRKLWTWLLHENGAAYFADALARRQIRHDLQGEAPDTTSTAEALVESQGVAEHILIEAFESETPGFKGGLVCVQDAADYLARNGKKISTKKVGAILKDLGYIVHPAIAAQYSSGRVWVANSKRRIMVKKGSLFQNLESANSVTEKWLELKTLAVHEMAKGGVR